MACAISIFLLRELLIISKRRYHETNSDYTRTQMRLYMNELTCGTCHGYRLNDQALSVRVGGAQGPHIGEISDLSIADHLELVSRLTLSENETIIARPILKEIKDRLTFLNNVGLNYLTLSSFGRNPFRWGKSAYSFGNP